MSNDTNSGILIPNSIIDDYGPMIGNKALAYYLSLTRYVNKGEYPINIYVVGKQASLSKAKTDNAIPNLVSHGLIRVEFSEDRQSIVSCDILTPPDVLRG